VLGGERLLVKFLRVFGEIREPEIRGPRCHWCLFLPFPRRSFIVEFCASPVNSAR
jgi:hypothetical protein